MDVLDADVLITTPAQAPVGLDLGAKGPQQLGDADAKPGSR